MNPNKVKTLVQTQAHPSDPKLDRLSVTVLLTEDLVQSLLDQLRSHEDKRSALVAEIVNFNAEIVIEIYQPEVSKNLRYVQNLKRDGKERWSTHAVSPL